MKTLSLFATLCVWAWIGAVPTQAQQPIQSHLPPEIVHTDPPPAAQAAVDAWLGKVDNALYDEAWQATSGLFRKAVPLDQWTNVAKSRRTPLGKMISRKLTGATFSKSLPGTPEGQYVVVEYTSSFEHKKTARETATAALDSDGQWRVSGYFVR